MADISKPLLRIGPFKSYDTTTAGPYVSPDAAIAGSYNVDTNRYTGAMVTSRGRVTLTALTGVIGNITALTRLNRTDVSERNAIASTISGGIVRYNITSGSQSTVLSGKTFTQAVQFGNVLYTNAGQQIRPASNYNAYYWNGNYAFSDSLQLSVATGSATGTLFLLPATYYYAFTTEYLYPDQGTQESPPGPRVGNPNVPATLALFALSGTIATGSASGIITLNPSSSGFHPGLVPWYGTAPDGSLYTTNIYRASTNQPTFYFAGNANSGTVSSPTGTYTDKLGDALIASGTQLQLRYQNPSSLALIAGGTDYSPIFSHKERMWIFTMFEDALLTSGITQCQLWFSDSGIPWSFFADTGVILVGDDSDNVSASSSGTDYTGLLNDQPMGGAALSSVAILHKRRSTWILYGDDPSTFIPRKMGDVGTVSSGSITICHSNGDVDAWLSEDGPYLTDGNTLSYIGDPMREILATIPQTDWVQSVGWYSNRTWHLSFPATAITLRYYLPTGQWLPPLPYATTAAYALPSESSPVGLTRLQETIATRTIGAGLDLWNASDGADLGQLISAKWISPLSDSGAPGIAKEFQWVVVNALLQSSGTVCTVLFQIDQNVSKITSGTCDLSLGPTFVFEVQTTNPGDNVGFMCQVTIELTTATSSVPAQIYSVEVYGSPMRNLVPSQQGVT